VNVWTWIDASHTLDEAAARMGVGRKHVLELVRAGELRTILVGSDRRIPAVFILEYYLRASA
jgi:excisionase family DNA binding protein